MAGLILLTGATGYVGGRLLSRLQQRGLYTRCVTRRPEALLDRITATTSVVEGDVFKPQSLQAAFEGVETAYYFVHSQKQRHTLACIAWSIWADSAIPMRNSRNTSAVDRRRETSCALIIRR